MADSEIDIEPIGNGIKIQLPNRTLGSAKKVGWLILLLSVMVTLFMIGWIAVPASMGVGMLVKGDMSGALFLVFGCVGLGGLYTAAKMMSLAIAVLRDRTRSSVSIDGKRILCREHFGWFSHRRKIKRDEVDQLYIAPVGVMSNSGGGRSEGRSVVDMIDSILDADLGSLYSIVTKKRNGKQIVPGYSKEILESVASAIATELNRNRTDNVLISRDVPADDQTSVGSLVTVQNLTEEEAQSADYVLPEDSQIEVVEDGESLVYRIPERSLMKGSSGPFFFALIWNGLMLFFTVSIFFAKKVEPFALLFLLPFWGIGIAILVGVIYVARQSAMIGVKDGLLFIERKTIFGTKWIEFTANQIKTIEMAYANMEVNNVKVMNLQIEPIDQKPVSMLAHLENSEIQWLAQQLRRSLGVESKKNKLAVSNDLGANADFEAPPETDLKIQHDSNSTIITVPPLKFEGSQSLWALSLGFLIVPLPAAIVAMFFVGFNPMFIVVPVFVTMAGAAMFSVHQFIATRNYVVTAMTDELNVEVLGFMANRRLSVSRPEIRSVEVVDSETKLNNRTLYCLRIREHNGKGLTMMTGRDENDLVYVARLIHQQLRIDS